MKRKNSRFSTFNDGMLYVCKPESERTSFNAVKNPTHKTDITKIEKLAFCEMSKREEDMDFAESQGRTLTAKVKTRLRKNVSKLNQILIDKTLYSIIKIDKDRAREEMYIYLEEVRELS